MHLFFNRGKEILVRHCRYCSPTNITIVRISVVFVITACKLTIGHWCAAHWTKIAVCQRLIETRGVEGMTTRRRCCIVRKRVDVSETDWTILTFARGLVLGAVTVGRRIFTRFRTVFLGTLIVLYWPCKLFSINNSSWVESGENAVRTKNN
eukprot:COSAG02_NODE_1225_length_13785_cov_12.911588_5_plen_151_part_00